MIEAEGISLKIKEKILKMKEQNSELRKLIKMLKLELIEIKKKISQDDNLNS